MTYLCCSTTSFAKQYFAKGITREAIEVAPSVLFDQKDKVHSRFFAEQFGWKKLRFPHHIVPSSNGFLDAVLSGIAYGLVPELQAREPLKKKKLKNVAPRKRLDVPLYYHYPRKEALWEEELREALLEAAAGELSQHCS